MTTWEKFRLVFESRILQPLQSFQDFVGFVRYVQRHWINDHGRQLSFYRCVETAENLILTAYIHGLLLNAVPNVEHYRSLLYSTMGALIFV